MKKNLMSVLILALVVVNLALTALLLLTVLPQAKRANELVSKVASAIELELSSGQIITTNTIPIDDIETYDIPDVMLINLQKSDVDGSDGHHAQLGVTLSLNTRNSDFENGKAQLSTKESLVKDAIIRVVSSYSPEQLRADQQGVQKEVLKELQGLFESNFIVGVSFPTFTVE